MKFETLDSLKELKKGAHSYLPAQLPKRQRWELSEDEDEDEIVYFVALLVPLCFLLQGQKRVRQTRASEAGTNRL